jgi:hypothetical protein
MQVYLSPYYVSECCPALTDLWSPVFAGARRCKVTSRLRALSTRFGRVCESAG